MTHTKKKLLIIAAALVITGGVVGGGLYLAYPVQVSTFAGLSRNFFITLGAPAGTVTTETNPAYRNPVPASSLPTTEVSPNTASADWPSGG
jgi:alcohol dehydrogenase (cytochrome c)